MSSPDGRPVEPDAAALNEAVRPHAQREWPRDELELASAARWRLRMVQRLPAQLDTA
jgi:hypothetical protein